MTALTDPDMASLLTVLLLTYCRVQACLLALPAFSMRGLPVRLRVALAMSLTPLLAEFAAPPAGAESLPDLSMLCAAEIVTGLALGGLVRLFAFALEIAASAIAATASLSQIMGVANEFSPHPIGNLLHLAGLALLMAMGYPLLVCDLLRESLALRPVGGWPVIAELMPTVLGLIRRSFVLAMLLAAPFILGGFLFQALSGMISKVMPALPVMFIAAPGAILLALLALVLLTPSILSVWADAVLNVMAADLP
ncbi:flagellar biosynthetic protein FliR [Paracoccus laeviglucosivorans]|uniref:Flagellar biosynthetic protein FliR n=1 Tax=Paracoccus laeviglucosivorans TaxID=1197861 RepID=A0A521DR34_9RHOB|nr:flagellar biosynthetic protein FliR [Paracoccus laeviglucosivorans]SMO74164.1 flagellar biosynthetic protein FliR [Paracoccus laeviglucosivorans]